MGVITSGGVSACDHRLC